MSRYPTASQALLARYTIARSFHSAAEEPAKKARLAKTENERQKNRKLRDQNLESALQNYLDVQRRITLGGHADESPADEGTAAELLHDAGFGAVPIASLRRCPESLCQYLDSLSA